MPQTLPEDTLDYHQALVRVRTIVGETDPFYRCIMDVVRRTNTTMGARAYVNAILPFLRWGTERGLDWLMADRDVISDYITSDMTLAGSTRSMRLQLVRNIYEEAIERGLVTKNPARRLRVRGTQNDGGPPGLSAAQARQVLGRMRADFDDPKRGLVTRRDYLIVYIGLKLGLRTTEMRRLTYGDFSRPATRTVVEVLRKGGKTGRLLVPQGVVDAIAEWRSTLVDHDVIPSADDPIICRLQAARFHGMEVVTPLTSVSSRTIFSAVEHWLDLIGITGARRGAHRLRRSAATIAWEGHADLASIQTMLGHENVNTTVRNYIRPSEDLLRPASDCIDIDP